MDIACVTSRGAIFLPLNSFTHFRLHRLWAVMEGFAHPDMMCIPDKNVWNCLSAVMEGSEHPHMVEIPQRKA